MLSRNPDPREAAFREEVERIERDRLWTHVQREPDSEIQRQYELYRIENEMES